MKRISVCMATYNGEQYIDEQIETILLNLSKEDEIIISDDSSKDHTVDKIRVWMEKDSRIRLLQGPCKGVIKNFENAIMHAKGQYIFLADQDDLWKEEKVRIVMKCFQDPECYVVLHDAEVIDKDNNIIFPSFYEFRNTQKGVIRNMIKNSYIGCCMAFRKELSETALPFPDGIPMHDQWIGILGELQGKAVFLDDILLTYRRHEKNASEMTHMPVGQMIKYRLVLCICLINRYFRIKRNRK